MRSTRSFPIPLIAVFLLLVVAGGKAGAQGNLLFTLDSVLQSGTPGSEVFFTGTLTNTGSSPLYLNGIGFNFQSPASTYLAGDPSVFFNNTPVSLAASGLSGDTYAGQIFGINVAPSTPLGTYTGSVTLTGGADGNATNSLATQNFGVSVASAGAVPESSTLLSAGLMMGAGALLLSRRKRNRHAKQLTLPTTVNCVITRP